jgi:hypothetical protein
MTQSPLSSPACEARWQRPAAESFYVHVFAALAARCSGSVATVTEGTATAVRPAATKAIAKGAAWRTSVTRKVPRDDSIIETVSAPCVGAGWSRKKV